MPVLLLATALLGLVLFLWGRPVAISRPVLAATAALANLLSTAAMLGRARACPEEGRGWRLLGASLALLALANLGAGFLPRFLTAGTVVAVVLGVASQVLACAGLVGLPWHQGGLRFRLRNVPGSFLFTGSILLILSTFMDWGTDFRSRPLTNLAMVGASGRLLVLGTVALVLLEQDLRRIRGVLGYVLANGVLGALYLGILQNRLAQGWVPAPPLAGAYALAPLVLGLAAWSRTPLEFPEQPLESNRVWESLPYLAFALAAGLLLVRFLAEGTLPRAPMAGFVLLTFLLLLRQCMLLHDLRRQNQSLEGRVRQRTRDLEAMQAAVLRTERLNTLAALGAGIAHDLNNYLGVIHANAEFIAQAPDRPGASWDRHLARIQASSERAGALTRRLLGLARRDTHPPEVLDLTGELAHLEDLLRMLLPDPVGLRLALAPGPFPVRTRKSNLEQILVNLVGNAKDAMPDGGTVTIRLDAGPGTGGAGARLQVEDTGPGLPPAIADHLFEPFVTTKAEGKGTGLGLATVKHLVEGDGGTVAVRSSAAGCRFVITYPLAADPAAPGERSA